MALIGKDQAMVDDVFYGNVQRKLHSTPSSNVYKTEDQKGKVHLAVIGGFFGTMGSLFGKLASSVQVFSMVTLLVKSIALILMVTSNTIGCTLFVKALAVNGSSLPCTIASAATSYVCSVLAGFLIFGESTSITWWCGISFVLLGLLFICNVPSQEMSPAVTKKLK